MSRQRSQILEISNDISNIRGNIKELHDNTTQDFITIERKLNEVIYDVNAIKKQCDGSIMIFRIKQKLMKMNGIYRGFWQDLIVEKNIPHLREFQVNNMINDNWHEIYNMYLMDRTYYGKSFEELKISHKYDALYKMFEIFPILRHSMVVNGIKYLIGFGNAVVFRDDNDRIDITATDLPEVKKFLNTLYMPTDAWFDGIIDGIMDVLTRLMDFH